MTARPTLYLTPCALLLAALPAAAGVFGLAPSSGIISGLPGSNTGWSYAVNNTTGHYLVVANSYFCESGQDPLFTTCTQTLGANSDFIAAAATNVAPDATASGTFSALAGQGVGKYAIRTTAALGQQDAGNIVIVYDVFTANPFTDPTAQQIGGDVEVTLPAAVQVTSPTVPALAPAAAAALAFMLMLCGALYLWRRDFSLDKESL